MNTYCYRNIQSRMVILRCVGPNHFFQEKVILPFESWCLECPADSRIDIWSHGLTGAELLDSLPATQLVDVPSDPAAEPHHGQQHEHQHHLAHGYVQGRAELGCTPLS